MLGFGSDDANDLVQVFREICGTPVEPDGLRFDASSVTVRFPVLLGGPAPTLRGYPLATVVAEKLESLTQLGLATSRMKDLYDVWHILRTFDLNRDEVRTAIVRTFEHRGTALAVEPTVLTEAFWADPSKRSQWSAFLRRSDLSAPDLEEVAREVAARLAPMLSA